MAQWIDYWPANPVAAGSIPSQGKCLGCGPGPPVGVCKRQPIDISLHIDDSPSLFLPLVLSL